MGYQVDLPLHFFISGLREVRSLVCRSSHQLKKRQVLGLTRSQGEELD